MAEQQGNNPAQNNQVNANMNPNPEAQPNNVAQVNPLQINFPAGLNQQGLAVLIGNGGIQAVLLPAPAPASVQKHANPGHNVANDPHFAANPSYRHVQGDNARVNTPRGNAEAENRADEQTQNFAAFKNKF